MWEDGCRKLKRNVGVCIIGWVNLKNSMKCSLQRRLGEKLIDKKGTGLRGMRVLLFLANLLDVWIDGSCNAFALCFASYQV